MLEFGVAMGQSSRISVDLGRTRSGRVARPCWAWVPVCYVYVMEIV